MSISYNSSMICSAVLAIVYGNEDHILEHSSI